MIALNRAWLAVQRTFSLDLYRPATGTKARSIPLGPTAALQLVDVNTKLALLAGRGRLVLVRLSDGKLISVAYRKAIATSVVAARLTDAGLFFAYNVRAAAARGRIGFESTARLLARF